MVLSQHFLNFLPEPQWQGSFLPIFFIMPTIISQLNNSSNSKEGCAAEFPTWDFQHEPLPDCHHGQQRAWILGEKETTKNSPSAAGVEALLQAVRDVLTVE
jgi:hypothetical protein